MELFHVTSTFKSLNYLHEFCIWISRDWATTAHSDDFINYFLRCAVKSLHMFEVFYK